MPTLTINRSNEYVNRLRAIKILVNGKEIGTIKNGETKSFELPSGNHQLQAKIDWCTSNKVQFNITEGQTKTFYMDSFANHNRIGKLATIFYIFFNTGSYLQLNEVVNV